jgi:hypothetical protein
MVKAILGAEECLKAAPTDARRRGVDARYDAMESLQACWVGAIEVDDGEPVVTSYADAIALDAATESECMLALY